MIEQLRECYNSGGEIVVPYNENQEQIYKKAMKELKEKAKHFQHHKDEIEELRDKIQRRNEKEEGLGIDLMSCCKNPRWYNFAAMVVKRFLTNKGFRVLTSSEDFNLILDRGTRYDTKGFTIITKILGEKRVEELMRKAQRNGGEPDLFVYLDYNPNNVWFVEAKRDGEGLTSAQIENFPFIRDLLCPIEIARIVPSNISKLSSSVEGSENIARNTDKFRSIKTPVTSCKPSKAIWYAVNGVQGTELPTLFERCIKSLRERGTADVTLREDIDAEETIFRFRHHQGYQRFTMRCKPTPEELENVFAAIRSVVK